MSIEELCKLKRRFAAKRIDKGLILKALGAGKSELEDGATSVVSKGQFCR
jgi:hypothetical protein